MARSLRRRNDRSEKVGNRGQIFTILRRIVVLFAEKSGEYGPIPRFRSRSISAAQAPRPRLPYLLIIPILAVTGQGLVPAQTSACADHSISAGAVRTYEEVEAFVKCAYEFVQEVGFEEAHRAFHEDDRWRKGANYIFVSEDTPVSEETRSLVFSARPRPEKERRLHGCWTMPSATTTTRSGIVS